MVYPGEHEAAKVAVHGVLAGLALTCAVYNTAAYARRSECHLLVNALVYWPLVGFEITKVCHHLFDRP